MGPAAVADDLAGGVEQPVAQPFGFGGGELAVQAGQLRPGEEVLGDQGELEPGLVVLEGVMREVAHAGVLACPDPVLDPGAPAVAQLQPGNVLAVLVGEKTRVSIAVLVEDRELRAGVWALAPADQPRPLSPSRQVQVLCQLGDPGAVTPGTIGIDRLCPRGLWEPEDRLARGLIDRVADERSECSPPGNPR